MYNMGIAYSQNNATYSGTIIIYAPSLENPITLNNISIISVNQLNYSNYTTVAVLSIDTAPDGTITVSVVDETASALIGITSFSNLGHGLIAVS
jgi:hypothetical protein